MYRVGQEEKDAVARVIDAKCFFKINDAMQETQKTEEAIKEKFCCKNTIIMTSGQGALISALTAMGVGPGDEVIVPACTYIATAMTILAVGAIPVIAECDETLTLNPVDAEKKITSHTKAIIPVYIQDFSKRMEGRTGVQMKCTPKWQIWKFGGFAGKRLLQK